MLLILGWSDWRAAWLLSITCSDFVAQNASYLTGCLPDLPMSLLFDLYEMLMLNYIFFNEGALFPSSIVFSGRNCRGCTHATQQNLLWAATAVKCQAGIQCVLIRVTWPGSMGSLSSLPKFLLRKTDPPTSPIIVNHSCGWWLRMTTLKVRPSICFYYILLRCRFSPLCSLWSRCRFPLGHRHGNGVTYSGGLSKVQQHLRLHGNIQENVCWWEKNAEFNMTEYIRAIPNLEKRFWRFC